MQHDEAPAPQGWRRARGAAGLVRPARALLRHDRVRGWVGGRRGGAVDDVRVTDLRRLGPRLIQRVAASRISQLRHLQSRVKPRRRLADRAKIRGYR